MVIETRIYFSNDLVWPEVAFYCAIGRLCVCLVGIEVFCAETVMNPMQLYPQDNVNVLPPADEIKFLLTLRLVLSQRVDLKWRKDFRSIKRISREDLYKRILRRLGFPPEKNTWKTTGRISVQFYLAIYPSYLLKRNKSRGILHL